MEPEPEPDPPPAASASPQQGQASLPLVLGRGLFADNAVGLRQALARCANRDRLLGYAVVFMGLDRPPPGRPYVAYQLEQLRSEMINEEFAAVLRGAAAVWDFSLLHAAHWTEFGLPGAHMPLWHTLPRSAVSPTAPEAAAAHAAADDGSAIDVLLFGSMNVRREVMGSLLTDAGLNVVFKRFTDFDEQQDCIRRASIVANIHFHPEAALEVHRLDPLLANGVCVLSEPSADPELDALYSDVCMFARYDDFVGEAVRLLASVTRRQAMGERAREVMWQRQSEYPQRLHDALEVLPPVDAAPTAAPSDSAWSEWASGTPRSQFVSLRSPLPTRLVAVPASAQHTESPA